MKKTFILIFLTVISLSLRSEDDYQKNAIQRIAFDIDKNVFCCLLDSKKTIVTTKFMTDLQFFSLGGGKENADAVIHKDPLLMLTIAPGNYFWCIQNRDIVKLSSYLRGKDSSYCYLTWYIYALDGEKDEICVNVATKGKLNDLLKTALVRSSDISLLKVLCGEKQPLLFSFVYPPEILKRLIAQKAIGSLKLKFPSGKIFEYKLKGKRGKVDMTLDGSQIFEFDLEELLKESKEFSMKDFEYGLTELVWEVKLDDGKVLTRNFWLVKFNGELPKDNGNGYKLDGPLSLETFRDNKISVLPPARADLPKKEPSKKSDKSGESEKRLSAPSHCLIL